MTNTRLRLFLFTLLAAITLAGCDSVPFMDNSPDYKSASRGKPLEVPPDLTSVSTSDIYAVPGGGATYSQFSKGQEQIKNEPEKILPNAEGVKLERAGTQRWLVVEAPPEKIWPVVRDFWTELGFAVRIENTQTGVMETEWVDPSDLTKDNKGNYLDKFQGWLDKMSNLSSRQKFRTRLDRGADAGTTEIYISHTSVSSVQTDNKTKVRTVAGEVDTGYKPDDPKNSYEGASNKGAQADRASAEDLDAELLRRLMVRLGVQEQQSRALIAADNTEKRAVLGKGKDGVTVLTVNDPFDRAWRRVSLAIDRIGFAVEDRDRSRGEFNVRYSNIDSDESKKGEEGWLDKMKFWGDDEKNKTELNKQFIVKVESAESTSKVYVMNKDGQQARSPAADSILNMLYEQLK
jgi:outer membrane protein assembly factor BamC